MTIKQLRCATRHYVILLSVFFCALAAPAHAMDLSDAKKILTHHINSWVTAPQIIAAIKAQNLQTTTYDQAQIDALDKAWRAGDTASIEHMMRSPLSVYLQDKVEESKGLYTEIIIMDARGLNVALSDKTSDFWQGDEEKFIKTFEMGPGAMYLGPIELDESSQTYGQQLSITITENGVPIGAATIGLSTDMPE